MLRVAKDTPRLQAWTITALRWLLMIVVPLVLVVLEHGHPKGFARDVYGALNPMADEWLRLHLLQSPLFGLMAVAALNLTWGLRGPLAVG